ncbi:MAG: T9SS type A sorting domain-containing protein [Bacteroidetes bacterium]|nr:T9SS type A sorting domain-containing protein [Bacteroidota bacterium]
MKKYIRLLIIISIPNYLSAQQIVTDSVKTDLGNFVLQTSENEPLLIQVVSGDSSTTSDGGNASYLIGIDNGGSRIQNPLQQENNLESISLNPNPADGIVEVKLVGMHSIITLSILDPLGRIVINNPLFMQGDRTVYFDMTEYSNGIYFVQVITQNTTFTKRLIRE